MDGLKILHAQTPEVFLGGEDRTVAQNPPKEFQIPAPPEVFAGKRMTAGMRRHPNTRDRQSLPECLEFSREIPHRDLGVVSRWKEKTVDASRCPLQPFPKRLPQLKGNRHEPVFAALAEHFDGEIVQIHVFFREGERLRDPQASIEKKADQRVKPPLSSACWPVGEHFLYGGLGECGEDLLLLLEFGNPCSSWSHLK